MKLLALATLLFAAPLAAAGAELKPGAPAPVLKDVQWLKGEPVASWQPGHVYVLDFWATWCGPCKASIPHIDKLAEDRAKDNVHVLGVAIWPKPNMVPTSDFVTEKGDAMSYGICEDVDGKTATTFMEAAGQNGIPTCMVVDKAGNLAWIGHPMMGLDQVVDEVVAGTWDTPAFARKFAAAKENEAKANGLSKDYGAARKAGDWAKAAQIAGELYALDAEQYGNAAFWRYDALLRAGEKEQAARFGRELSTAFKENAQGLNGLAWMIVDPEAKREQPDLELAHAAATKANDLTAGKEPAILDTLARVVFLQGDVAKAIELQQKAVDLAPADEKSNYSGALAEYQAAKT